MPTFIPHIDLRGANAAPKRDFLRGLETLYDQGAFSGGEYVARFEADFARYLGAADCVGVNSGTSAIHLALLALGIGPGDEVVVPAYTFAGSVWGVIYCGAKPVFADVDPATGNLDPAAVEKVLTKRTRAIIVVHLFGQCAPMRPFRELARSRGIRLIEDAAQAHGQISEGRQAGTLGDIGCFSFYPTKNLGGIGEAGAVAVSKRAWADRLRLLRSHNSPKRFEHAGVGFNYRMDGIQALFLALKLKDLDALNAVRRSIAATYLDALRGGPIEPLCRGTEDSVWHAFVCRTPKRKAFLERLDAAGIGHALYYPRMLPEQAAFKAYAPDPKRFPAAKALSKTAVSLPLYPGLGGNDIGRVANVLRSWGRKG
jgi:dTDP-4-amino-4,6-dideoxygalactose transaminase